jgi:hypothetical protein
MGDSLPYPNPVQFDKALAAAAVSALQDAVINLDSFTQSDVSLGEVALQNWKGRYADQYRDRDLPWIKREAGSVKAELQTWIKKIQQAADDAARLQRLHDAANTAYQAAHASSGPK